MSDTPTSQFGEGVRKRLIDYVLAACLGFLSAWLQSQWSLGDLRYKIERLEEKERGEAAAEARRADAELNHVREMERIAGAVKNLAERQQEMREEQNRRR